MFELDWICEIPSVLGIMDSSAQFHYTQEQYVSLGNTYFKDIIEKFRAIN